MSKAVMISIRPKWCEKICRGEKTVEVRKTRPKMETPFKCYIYETQGWVEKDNIMVFKLGGRVIGEFTCDRIYKLETRSPGGSYLVDGEDKPTTNRVARESCLGLADMHRYLQSKAGYGWHISELKIYDTPKELTEFHTWKKCKSCSKSGYESTACIYDENCMVPVAITKAPQSWCYVEEQK
nr:MAG TPA: hypothetical protein [Caudoviricetes sp.]